MKKNKLKTLIAIFFGISILWIAVQIGTLTYFNDWATRGTFGDSFGAVNSLFSGLAFGGLIYTILLQRKELELQRQELAETRKELKRSADAQEKSEQALNSQIQTLNITSEINGLNAVIANYGMVMQKHTNGGSEYWAAHGQQRPYLERLEVLLEDIKRYNEENNKKATNNTQ